MNKGRNNETNQRMATSITNDELTHLLENRCTAHLEWDEQWEVEGKNGEMCDGDITHCANIQDCINYQRLAVSNIAYQQGSTLDLSDLILLDYFIVNHLARVKK